MLKFALAQRRAWHFFFSETETPVSWETPLSGFCFIRQLTDCKGSRKSVPNKSRSLVREPNVKAVGCETSL